MEALVFSAFLSAAEPEPDFAAFPAASPAETPIPHAAPRPPGGGWQYDPQRGVWWRWAAAAGPFATPAVVPGYTQGPVTFAPRAVSVRQC